MATAEGYLRRLTRRLTEDPQQLDVEELSDEAANTGAQKAIDCQRGQEVTMVGTLRSVEANAKGWTVVDMKKEWSRIYPYDK